MRGRARPCDLFGSGVTSRAAGGGGSTTMEVQSQTTSTSAEAWIAVSPVTSGAPAARAAATTHPVERITQALEQRELPRLGEVERKQRERRLRRQHRFELGNADRVASCLTKQAQLDGHDRRNQHGRPARVGVAQEASGGAPQARRFRQMPHQRVGIEAGQPHAERRPRPPRVTIAAEKLLRSRLNSSSVGASKSANMPFVVVGLVRRDSTGPTSFGSSGPPRRRRCVPRAWHAP